MERTNEEWGRIAVGLPGWRWMPGMRGVRDDGSVDIIMDHSEAKLPNHDIAPDPDDPATEGCLMRLLGPLRSARQALRRADHHDAAHRLHIAFMLGKDVGRACIAAAEALGRWPASEYP